MFSTLSHFFFFFTAVLATSPSSTKLLPVELEDVGIDQSVIGNELSRSLVFADELGKTGPLESFLLPNKPSLISVVYYNCPGLCSLHMNGAATVLKELKLKAGKDFNWILITMDSSESPDLALKKKVSYIDEFQVPGADEGWKFLTGSKASVEQITKDLGFSFKWDPKTKQFAHSAAFYAITPEAVISQIIPGVGFEEQTVRLALVEAAKGTIGTVVDQLLLFCFKFDPTKNKFTLYAYNLMRIASVLTVMILGIILVPLWLKERARGIES